MKRFRCLVRLATACAGLLAIRGKAQDVTVSAPTWFLPEAAPDEPAKIKGRLRPDYPDEMSKTGEQGYAIISDYVDAKNQNLSRDVNGTHAPFEREVEAALHWSTWSVIPARRGGQAINSRIWVAVIFNPKSASADGPNATPRLLEVSPVTTPQGGPDVIRMRLSLDATGAITKMIHESEVNGKTLKAIREALPGWRFAPARQNGQPVPAEIVVPVLCLPPWMDKSAVIVPPRATYQVAPVYPFAMRRFGLRGTVVVDFQVDANGRVQNAVIAQSNNPAFDEPALEAVRKWKFQPGTRNGQPVKLAERVPIIFEIEGGPSRDAYEIVTEKDQSKLPPEFRFDTPPKLRGVWIPVYPYALERDDITGQAKVTVSLDPRGRVSGIRVDQATRPEFALALTAAVEGFSFEPALKDGKPVPNLLSFEQSFNLRELPDDRGEPLLSLEKRSPEKILNASKLDAPLRPVSRRAPVFPVNLRAAGTTGTALIEVVIDEDGHARLPRIVSASDDALGYAAVQAAATWIFTPPTVNGKPVNVRVQIPFAFNLRSPNPADDVPVAPGNPE